MREVVARGSFFEVGYQVGQVCKDDIFELYDYIVAYLRKNTGSSQKQIQEITDGCMLQAEDLWTPSVEFLHGLAKGAGVPVRMIALMSFAEEAFEFLSASAKCSTLVVSTEQGPLIGHNEDYWPIYLGKMVLIDAIFTGYPRTVGVTYPGMLPNLAGSFGRRKKEGVIILNNSLWMETKPGLSKQVQHFRASLASDLGEAVIHLAQSPVSVTTHYTVAESSTGKVMSIEVSNMETAYAAVEMTRVGPKPFIHTNHARLLKLREPDPAVVAGNHTLARFAKLEALTSEQLPSTLEGIVEHFSTNDGVLNRTPEQNPTSVTLVTLGYLNGKVMIRDADPSSTKRDYHFNLYE